MTTILQMINFLITSGEGTFDFRDVKVNFKSLTNFDERFELVDFEFDLQTEYVWIDYIDRKKYPKTVPEITILEARALFKKIFGHFLNSFPSRKILFERLTVNFFYDVEDCYGQTFQLTETSFQIDINFQKHRSFHCLANTMVHEISHLLTWNCPKDQGTEFYCVFSALLIILKKLNLQTFGIDNQDLVMASTV